VTAIAAAAAAQHSFRTALEVLAAFQIGSPTSVRSHDDEVGNGFLEGTDHHQQQQKEGDGAGEAEAAPAMETTTVLEKQGQEKHNEMETPQAAAKQQVRAATDLAAVGHVLPDTGAAATAAASVPSISTSSATAVVADTSTVVGLSPAVASKPLPSSGAVVATGAKVAKWKAKTSSGTTQKRLRTRATLRALSKKVGSDDPSDEDENPEADDEQELDDDGEEFSDAEIYERVMLKQSESGQQTGNKTTHASAGEIESGGATSTAPASLTDPAQEESGEDSNTSEDNSAGSNTTISDGSDSVVYSDTSTSDSDFDDSKDYLETDFGSKSGIEAVAAARDVHKADYDKELGTKDDKKQSQDEDDGQEQEDEYEDSEDFDFPGDSDLDEMKEVAGQACAASSRSGAKTCSAGHWERCAARAVFCGDLQAAISSLHHCTEVLYEQATRQRKQLQRQQELRKDKKEAFLEAQQLELNAALEVAEQERAERARVEVQLQREQYRHQSEQFQREEHSNLEERQKRQKQMMIEHLRKHDQHRSQSGSSNNSDSDATTQDSRSDQHSPQAAKQFKPRKPRSKPSTEQAAMLRPEHHWHNEGADNKDIEQEQQPSRSRTPVIKEILSKQAKPGLAWWRQQDDVGEFPVASQSPTHDPGMMPPKLDQAMLDHAKYDGTGVSAHCDRPLQYTSPYPYGNPFPQYFPSPFPDAHHHHHHHHHHHQYYYDNHQHHHHQHQQQQYHHHQYYYDHNHQQQHQEQHHHHHHQHHQYPYQYPQPPHQYFQPNPQTVPLTAGETVPRRNRATARHRTNGFLARLLLTDATVSEGSSPGLRDSSSGGVDAPRGKPATEAATNAGNFSSTGNRKHYGDATSNETSSDSEFSASDSEDEDMHAELEAAIEAMETRARLVQMFAVSIAGFTPAQPQFVADDNSRVQTSPQEQQAKEGKDTKQDSQEQEQQEQQDSFLVDAANRQAQARSNPVSLWRRMADDQLRALEMWTDDENEGTDYYFDVCCVTSTLKLPPVSIALPYTTSLRQSNIRSKR
jgi:hypothetical protein